MEQIHEVLATPFTDKDDVVFRFESFILSAVCHSHDPSFFDPMTYIEIGM